MPDNSLETPSRTASLARALRVSVLGALLALGCASSLRAQSASAYLPLDDAGYRFVDALMARGELRSLSALERPYTTKAIRRALAADSGGERSGLAARALASWRRALRESLEKYEPAPRNADTTITRLDAAMSFGAILTGQTSGRRELMLPDTTPSSVRPGGLMRVQIRAGNVIAATRIIGDNRLKDDPEYLGRKNRVLAGRAEDAYVSAQWRFGEIFLGRQARNWGPAPLDGLQLGTYAFSWDHLATRLGTDRLHLSSVIARLDNLIGPENPSPQRYFSAHRLGGRWRDFEASVSETYLYGGVARGFEPTLVNPLAVFSLSQYNDQESGNLSWGADAAWRAGRRGVYAAQLFVDDFQIDKCTPNCKEPPSYGFSLTAEGMPLAGGQRAFASYTKLSNLAYRTRMPFERYTSLNLGLGRGFTDYDEARLGLDLALVPRVPLRVYVAKRRQGEGDYRQPFPLPADFATTPGFLTGRVARVTRVAVSGGGRFAGGADLALDVGYDKVDASSAHLLGPFRDGLAARVRLSFEPHWASIRVHDVPE